MIWFPVTTRSWIFSLVYLLDSLTQFLNFTFLLPVIIHSRQLNTHTLSHFCFLSLYLSLSLSSFIVSIYLSLSLSIFFSLCHDLYLSLSLCLSLIVYIYLSLCLSLSLIVLLLVLTLWNNWISGNLQPKSTLLTYSFFFMSD